MKTALLGVFAAVTLVFQLVDVIIMRAALRASFGAIAGTLLGLVAIMLLPQGDTAGGFLTGLGFQGAGWLLPFLIPPFAAIVAFIATRAAAFRTLGNLS